MSRFSNLSDYEFEVFIGDLLGVHLDVVFEHFRRGGDGGLDLRHVRGDGGSHIVQCKHYVRSAFRDLRRAARDEVGHLNELAQSTEIANYTFVTSQPLSPDQKAELVGILAPWVKGPETVLGSEDIAQLLLRHPQVERRHIKLWLSSHAQLAAYLASGVHARSGALAQSIAQALPLYVQGPSFEAARTRLLAERVLVIAGEPGIGKTTLAHMLIAELIGRGYEPIDVGTDIEEAWDVCDHSIKQVFLYDDFLGSTLVDAMRGGGDSRLLRFMDRVAASRDTFLILTTREHILRGALEAREPLARHDIGRTRYLLALRSYSELDRARILHNHVWQSGVLGREARRALVDQRSYWRIIRHRNFNPRIIEFVTGLQKQRPPSEARAEGFVQFAIATLDHPAEIWRTAFNHSLDQDARLLLLVFATFPDRSEVNDLKQAYDSWCELEALGSDPRRFERCLRVAEGTFLDIELDDEGRGLIRGANPGVVDFLRAELLRDSFVIAKALRSAVFLEQCLTIGRAAVEVGATDRLDINVWATAAQRGLAMLSASWHRSGGPDGQRAFHRWRTDEEVRAIGVIETALELWADADLFFLEKTLENVVVGWSAGFGDMRHALALARTVASTPQARKYMPIGWRDALKTLALRGREETEGWRHVLDVRDLLPEVFDTQEWDEMRNEFSGFAESELDWLKDQGDEQDALEMLELCAERFEVALSASKLRDTRESIEERMGPGEWLDDDREDWGEERIQAAEESAIVDGLFVGLLDDSPDG